MRIHRGFSVPVTVSRQLKVVDMFTASWSPCSARKATGILTLLSFSLSNSFLYSVEGMTCGIRQESLVSVFTPADTALSCKMTSPSNFHEKSNECLTPYTTLV